jgi:hypothetical protein
MNPSYVKTGVVGVTAVNVDVSANLTSPIVVGGNTLIGIVEVQMTANYDRDLRQSPGFPWLSDFTGSALSDYPRRLASGSNYRMQSCEAAGLINGGWATFVQNH